MVKLRHAKRTKRRKKKLQKREISLPRVFARIRKKVERTLVVKDKDDLGRFYLTYVKAGFSKCLDYNDALSADDVRHSDAFFYAASLRGICEDLIVLRFLATANDTIRQEYLQALTSKNLAEAIGAQYKFFKANNPLQPLFGAPFPLGNDKPAEYEQAMGKNIEERRVHFNRVAKSLGLSNPTILEMAKSVGLVAAYEFIYFLASNFVHFNPSSLMKLGWTNQTDKNFNFSVKHMSGYYGGMAIFYAAVLLMGFIGLLSFLPEFSAVKLDAEVAELEKFIGGIQRWPEIVTFEEMNAQPPLYFLLYAMREVMRPEGAVAYGQILQELKLRTSEPT
jgi:hypothetical protein